MNDTHDILGTLQSHACPSPASSSAEDSDAFNTTDARIYFGPLRSPEKKFLPMLTRGTSPHPTLSWSPLRRSPRLSTPKPQSSPRVTPPLAHRDRDVLFLETVPSRTNTPDIERDLQDEPPSALAMRISRAHDNPSPPPQSPSIAALPDIAFPLPHPSLSGFKDSPFALDSGSEIEDTTCILPSPSLDRNISPMPSTVVKEPGHADLISFDSISTPIAPPKQKSPALDSTKPFPSSNNLSVDDIYSQTPEPQAVFRLDDEHIILSDVAIHVNSAELSGIDECREVEEMVQEDKDEGSIDLNLSPPEGPPENFSTTFRQEKLSAMGERAPMVEEGYGPSGASQAEEDRSEKRHTQSPPTLVQESFGVCGGQVAGVRAQIFSQPSNPNDYVSPQTDKPTLVLPMLEQPPSPHSSESTSSNIVTDSLRPPKFPQQQTPLQATLPIRFTSPSRSTSQGDDPGRTPARRVPMAEAISQGYLSPLKESRILASSSRRLRVDAVHHSTLNMPTMGSPTRRVGISEMVRPVAQYSVGTATPIQSFAKLRVGSAEPLASEVRDFKVPKRAGSTPPPRTTKDTLLRTPIFSSLTPASPKKGKLPFPIVPIQKEPIKPIPEEPGTDTLIPSTSPAKPKRRDAPISAKATLKQTTSRIPRTIKPYGRPTPKPKPNGAGGSVLGVDSNIESAKNFKAIRRVSPSDTTVQCQFDDLKSQNPTLATYNTAPSLKRKRGVPEASPVRPRPVVLLRQVPRVVEANNSSNSKFPTKPTSIPQEKPPQKIRLVVDKPSNPARAQSPELSQSHPSSQNDKSGEPDTTDDRASLQDVSVDKEAEEAASTDVILSSPQTDTPASVGPESVRRTTRARKPTSNVQSATGSSATRRKLFSQASQRQEEIFMGMSATALRAITTSNTAKNQHYVAAQLETEIIRKEGQRPESPAVKIRTVSQRKQDEKSMQRRERAAKRAKQNQTETSGYSDGDIDSESDSDDQNSSPLAKRHKRGPGDEEDYQTPLRKLKRLKLGEDDETESVLDGRRVKWDRGLFTTIYLDEVKLGTRQPPRERFVKKGCLAPTAKSVLLDSLGNLPHAESPLTTLVKESVVVKRFVYDDDREPPPPVVKNTRSRNRKTKS